MSIGTWLGLFQLPPYLMGNAAARVGASVLGMSSRALFARRSAAVTASRPLYRFEPIGGPGTGIRGGAHLQRNLNCDVRIDSVHRCSRDIMGLCGGHSHSRHSAVPYGTTGEKKRR